jgi:hypothetical protein
MAPPEAFLFVLAALCAVALQCAGQSGSAACALLIPDGDSKTCVTYESVNAAYGAARKKIGLPSVKGKSFSNADVGNLGTVIQETCKILANEYDLGPDAIATGLGMIDTRKTVIKENCPSFIVTPECNVERYRTVGGVCNNLDHPHWGAARRSHHRFLTPDFADSVGAPRVSSSGKPLPSARLVSATVHKDLGFHDHAVTVMLVAWGQFIDHDITLTAETKDPATGKTPKCCEGSKHPECLPIDIPKQDPFYAEHGQRCMNLARSVPGLKHDCRLGARASFNLVSSILDAGTVYGDNDEVHRALRAFDKGLLKVLPVFEEFKMKELLPLKLESPDEGCIRPSEDVYCFLAGDNRVNEQTVLAVAHLLCVREHNRIAKELAKINPHWNDETLYHETRHIVAALVQHITFNEVGKIDLCNA